MAYIYWVTCDSSMQCSFVKIGYWTKTFVSLRQRYATYYGANPEILVFTCKSYDARSIEDKVFKCLKQYHISRELYWKSQHTFEEFLYCTQRLTDCDRCELSISRELERMLRLQEGVHQLSHVLGLRGLTDTVTVVTWEFLRENMERIQVISSCSVRVHS